MFAAASWSREVANIHPFADCGRKGSKGGAAASIPHATLSDATLLEEETLLEEGTLLSSALSSIKSHRPFRSSQTSYERGGGYQLSERPGQAARPVRQYPGMPVEFVSQYSHAPRISVAT